MQDQCIRDLRAIDAWAEIDLNAISNNIRRLKSLLNPNCRLMAVVKANAYGHGMLEVAARALKNGADSLGVARLAEAITLRNAGIHAPILIFGDTPPDLAEMLIKYDLTPTLYSYDSAGRLSARAQSLGKIITAHLKIDTGMGRLGILPCDPGGNILDNAVFEVESMKRLPGIAIEGIYTHFATADLSDKTYALKQFDAFCSFTQRLKENGIEFPIKHAANSAAIIDMPETHLDMVRAGISIYGIYPSESVSREVISLKPAMALKSRIIHLKKVPAGFSVGYGACAKTTRPTIIATVSIGYGDGYNRLLSSKGNMLVHGRRAPVIGRVCMDQTMLDVGGIPDVAVGDEVVVFGTQGGSTITVDEISKATETISYEVVSMISNRVKRVYRT